MSLLARNLLIFFLHGQAAYDVALSLLSLSSYLEQLMFILCFVFPFSKVLNSHAIASITVLRLRRKVVRTFVASGTMTCRNGNIALFVGYSVCYSHKE